MKSKKIRNKHSQKKKSTTHVGLNKGVYLKDNRSENNSNKNIQHIGIESNSNSPMQFARSGKKKKQQAAKANKADSDEEEGQSMEESAASQPADYKDFPHLDYLLSKRGTSATPTPGLDLLAETRMESALGTLSELDKRQIAIHYGLPDDELAKKLVEFGITPDEVFDQVAELEYRSGFQQSGAGGGGSWQNSATRRLKRQTDEANKSAPGSTALHHKVARDTIKQWDPKFKFLANHPANYTIGPLPENRNDDPKTGLDLNFQHQDEDEDEVAYTPRSAYLSKLTGKEDPEEVKAVLDRLHENAGQSIETKWDPTGGGKFSKRK